jgi:hypothetical protein
LPPSKSRICASPRHCRCRSCKPIWSYTNSRDLRYAPRPSYPECPTVINRGSFFPIGQDYVKKVLPRRFSRSTSSWGRGSSEPFGPRCDRARESQIATDIERLSNYLLWENASRFCLISAFQPRDSALHQSIVPQFESSIGRVAVIRRREVKLGQRSAAIGKLARARALLARSNAH